MDLNLYNIQSTGLNPYTSLLQELIAIHNCFKKINNILQLKTLQLVTSNKLTFFNLDGFCKTSQIVQSWDILSLVKSGICFYGISQCKKFKVLIWNQNEEQN